jgi:Putative metallopeptidase
VSAAATVALLLSAGPLFAQTAPPASPSFAERVQEATRALVDKEPRLKRFPPQKRQALVEFVFGNILFVAAHELGHGVLAEFEVPNPGRDEDAADSFAIVTMLNIGNKFSDRVLVEAAKGWYLADRRDKKEGEKPAYYDAHGMNLQRAYQIICLMVGSDPEKYKELADIAKLPEERQASCKGDYTFAAWSWETLLKPKLRAPDQPKQSIELTYGEGKGEMDVYARVFRDIRFLETLREYIGERYAWPQPFVMVMETCDEVGANWRSRKLRICYEMAQDFAELYRDYGDALKKTAKRKSKSKR